MIEIAALNCGPKKYIFAKRFEILIYLCLSI